MLKLIKEVILICCLITVLAADNVSSNETNASETNASETDTSNATTGAKVWKANCTEVTDSTNGTYIRS